MRLPAALAWSLLTLLVVCGCASVEVTDRDPYQGGRVSRPGRIIVHDFAATPEDLPAWSEARTRQAAPSTPPSSEEIEVGRKLGAEVAQQLVSEIREMGLPGVRAAGESEPEIDDLVLVGYFASIDEGSAVERVVIGFGRGAPGLRTHVEGYRMTIDGLSKIGSGDTASESGKAPGVIVPALVTVATANPIGLIVGGAVKAGGELTGKSTIEGTARRTAEEIAEVLRDAFEKQGWI